MILVMGEQAIVFDTVLDLCEDRRRRIVLAALANEQRSLTVNDLSKAIVEYSDHAPVTEVSASRFSELQISLHHVHLPKIEATGLIDYDHDRKLVEPTELFEQVQPQISTVVETDPALERPVEL